MEEEHPEEIGEVEEKEGRSQLVPAVEDHEVVNCSKQQIKQASI